MHDLDGQVMHDQDRQVVGGVDTHGEVHVAAVIDATGRILAAESFVATLAGYRALLRWLRRHGRVVGVGVEGTGSYGAGLARYLAGEGVAVVEVNRPDRQRRRRRGKSDTVDAEAAARAALNGDAAATPKAGGGPVESVRVLRLARRSAIKARTQAPTRSGTSSSPPLTSSDPACGVSTPTTASPCAPASGPAT